MGAMVTPFRHSCVRAEHEIQPKRNNAPCLGHRVCHDVACHWKSRGASI